MMKPFPWGVFWPENICSWLLSFSPPLFLVPPPRSKYTWPWKTRCKFERGFTRWCRRPSNGGLPPHWRRWRPEPRRVGGFFRRRRPLVERPCPSETCVCWSLVGPHGITLQHFKGIHVYPSWHCHMCCSAMALHSQGICWSWQTHGQSQIWQRFVLKGRTLFTTALGVDSLSFIWIWISLKYMHAYHI